MTAEQLAREGGSPVRDTFLVFGSPDIHQEEIDEVVDSLRSGWIGTGPKVQRFEAMFRDYIGAGHAVPVGSCTAALHLSLVAAEVGQGDEVITTPMTFAASANAIIHTGATPVLVDCEVGTMNIDPNRIEEAITPRTRAILPVHFAGRPCDMDAITRIARDNGLLVIEDSAHCVEGRYHGRKVGTIGDLTCFSFYATKNVTSVEGGMVTTQNEEWATKIRTASLHGMSVHAWTRYSATGFKHYEVMLPGFKYNLTDVQAAIGIHQLARVDRNLERREEIWQRYDEAFAELPLRIPPPAEPDTTHARHLYTFLVDLDRLAATRDGVLDALQAENIGCGVHFVGVHLHDYYRKAFDLSPEDFPNATFISERTISIPLSPKLTDQDVDDVIAAVRKVLRAYAR